MENNEENYDNIAGITLISMLKTQCIIAREEKIINNAIKLTTEL